MYSKISIFTNESEYSQKRQNAKNEKIGKCIRKMQILQMRRNLKSCKIHRNCYKN